MLSRNGRQWPSTATLMPSIYHHRRFQFGYKFQFPSFRCYFIGSAAVRSRTHLDRFRFGQSDDDDIHIQFETVVFKHENILTQWLDFYLELSFISFVLYFILKLLTNRFSIIEKTAFSMCLWPSSSESEWKRSSGSSGGGGGDEMKTEKERRNSVTKIFKM